MCLVVKLCDLIFLSHKYKLVLKFLSISVCIQLHFSGSKSDIHLDQLEIQAILRAKTTAQNDFSFYW